MPTRAPRICSCGKTVASGTECACRARRKAEADYRRPTSTARGYDAAWRRVRADFLAAHPACAHPGCRKAATEADHVQSVAQRPDLRLSWSNLRPYCKPHHSQRTAREQAFGRASTRPADLVGCGGSATSGRGVVVNSADGGPNRRGCLPRSEPDFRFPGAL